MHELVSRFQQAFIADGLQKGDRVAAMMPNMPETIAAMLAVTSLGAIWSSCSPDFGSKGVLDRFGQISPKIFIACDGYWYGGKRIEIADKLSDIVPELAASRTVIVPLLGDADSVAEGLQNSATMKNYLAPYASKPVTFERLEFSHSLYIMFSSGTTGVPKCIVHSHGGSLMTLVKEHQLHVGMKEGDRVFYFTTCGWMMWNWAGDCIGKRCDIDAL